VITTALIAFSVNMHQKSREKVTGLQQEQGTSNSLKYNGNTSLSSSCHIYMVDL